MVKAILLCILRTIHAIVACISIATSFVTLCYVTVYNVTVAVYHVVLTVTVCHAVLTVTVCHFVLLLLYVMLCCVTVTVCYFTCTSTPTIYVVLQCMFVFSTKNQQHAELNHVLKYVRTIYFILSWCYYMSCHVLRPSYMLCYKYGVLLPLSTKKIKNKCLITSYYYVRTILFESFLIVI